MKNSPKGRDEWFYISVLFGCNLPDVEFPDIDIHSQNNLNFRYINWSVENKIAMKSYRYPTTIYCCVNRWLFDRKNTAEREEEEKKQCFCLSEKKTKSWAWVSPATKGKKGRRLMRRITRWKSWSHAFNRILPSNNTRTCFFQNQTCIGYFSGGKEV